MLDKMNDWLHAAYEYKASDIHLSVGVPPVFRINGELKSYGKEILTPEDTHTIAKQMIPEFMWQTFDDKGELDFSYSVPGISRFRVNAYRQRTSVAIAIRIIPSRVPSLEELALPSILNSLVDKPQGLILVTGPTGSGKSTTLASMIDYMNRTMKKHIITLEDPIEYLHRHNQCMIDQREVGFDTKSFATGLRASLRQDPDVILVGELRDLETIQTAITAAETGHLVLGTLHTTSAPSTIDRIIDVFPGPQQAQIRIQLASVLVSIISQRLFPSLDRQGRKVATEILVNTPAVANLIRNEKIHQIQNVMQTSRALGMHTLEMSIRQLIQNSEISRVSAESFLQETVN
ncbi:type IV pilus twitching motility protein PilT [Bacillus tianshenii]|uniref:type IV pilus twitching motility protein PilT n=1 Tax=Sutcliffiella tianshenii TaxID=1463404 RepID=UPI001CD71FF0|nr:type IV pilus twitching motility protein PilT [Bacillus tianshenii]MCA1318745.1 type IV pilus twitching motility protein PilT [Bacillus tianshenii]